MSDKEPEKLAHVEPSKVYTGKWTVLLAGGIGIAQESTQDKAESVAMHINATSEFLTMRRVDEALERAAVKCEERAYGQTVGVAMANQCARDIRSMKSHGATKGLVGRIFWCREFAPFHRK